MKIIYCAGEQGRVVLDSLRRGGVADVAFVDDDPTLWDDQVDGVPVVGGQEALFECDPNETEVLIAYGQVNGSRLAIAEPILKAGYDLFSVIDTDATVSETASLSEGVTVNAQAYVGPGATLGSLVLVDSGAIVSHDCQLANGVTVAPNATLAGGVTVGRDAYIGSGATVLDHITVGKKAVVGAGAVVTEPVQAGATVVGSPAKPVE